MIIENLSNRAIKSLSRRVTSQKRNPLLLSKRYSHNKNQERRLSTNTKANSLAIYYRHIIKPIVLKPDQYEAYRLSKNLMNISISSADENCTRQTRPYLNFNKMTSLDDYQYADEGIDSESPVSPISSSSSSWSSFSFSFDSFSSLSSNDLTDSKLTNLNTESNASCIDIDLLQIENDLN